MAKLIATLLGESEVQFGRIISSLEAGCGQPGIDIRLASEIRLAANQKIVALGLDPTDSTAEEIYYALVAKVGEDDLKLSETIGLDRPSNGADLLPPLLLKFEQLPFQRSAWAVKKSVIKSIISELPPKKVMAHLHYRSVSSMLKHESIGELLAGIVLMEDKHWQTAFYEHFSKLTPSDFERRKIEVIQLGDERWRFISYGYIETHRSLLMSLPELATIAVMPIMTIQSRGLGMALLAQLMHHFNHCRMIAAYLKFYLVSPKFGRLAQDLYSSREVPLVGKLAGQPLSWQTLLKCIDSHSGMSLIDEFEPRLNHEDIISYSAAQALKLIDPELDWWENSQHIGISINDQVVSFSLHDLAISFINNQTYSARQLAEMRRVLQRSLMARYCAEPIYLKQIIKQLDNKHLEPETISISLKSKATIKNRSQSRKKNI